MLSSKSCEWPTPQWFYDELDAEFHFTLDPCASDENHKCGKYFTIADDGLTKSWGGERVFCNPPYGRGISKWCEKAYREVTEGDCQVAVLLVHARTDTAWFHDWVLGKAELRFIRGRLCFGNKDRAPFPSLVAVYRRMT